MVNVSNRSRTDDYKRAINKASATRWGNVWCLTDTRHYLDFHTVDGNKRLIKWHVVLLKKSEVHRVLRI